MIRYNIPLTFMQRGDNLEIVISALIAAGGSIIGSYFANQKTTALISYRISELEKKVQSLIKDTHEMQALYARIEVLEERVKVANKRIQDLEDDASN